MPNRGVSQNVQTNDACVSFIDHDGTVYATVTGAGGNDPDASSWHVWKLAPDDTQSVFAPGAPLRQPNGIAPHAQKKRAVLRSAAAQPPRAAFGRGSALGGSMLFSRM